MGRELFGSSGKYILPSAYLIKLPDHIRRAHPDLAWQSSNIYAASISLNITPDGSTFATVSDVHHISGLNGSISSIDPKWLTETTGIFISDEGGWANPWTFTLVPADETGTGTGKVIVERAVKDIIEEEFGGPQWWLSNTYSATIGDSKAIFGSIREGRSVLSVFDFSLPIGERKRELVGVGVDVDIDYVGIQYVRGVDGKGVFLGQAATRDEELVELVIEPSTGQQSIKPLLPPQSPHPILKPSYISPPIYRRLSLPAVPSVNLPERICHIAYYAPKNPDYYYFGGKGKEGEGEKPPVVVLIHGGPFYMEPCGLDWKKQFWTSRGWA